MRWAVAAVGQRWAGDSSDPDGVDESHGGRRGPAKQVEEGVRGGSRVDKLGRQHKPAPLDGVAGT